jgi:hypothetical protein
LIEDVCGIGCWLLDMVRRQSGWWLGAEVFLCGGGRLRKFEISGGGFSRVLRGELTVGMILFFFDGSVVSV